MPRLLFVSPRFLFPTDSGGKIRTTQILRGLKGGAFEITLVSPLPNEPIDRFAGSISGVSDRFVGWTPPKRGRLFPVTRLRHLASKLPIPVATDISAEGRAVVAAELAKRTDIAVFDFTHAAVLAPERLDVRSVLFTHNIESEIFERHLKIAANPVMRAVWRDQLRKMRAFERAALNRFDCVVAVSERDKAAFEQSFGARNVSLIPTAVDLGFFRYVPPNPAPRVVFLGSMDWIANIDAIQYFADEIWPLIAARRPEAAMTVVGRNPPQSLVDRVTRRLRGWSFTGFVEDVRPHVEGAAAFVVPLRVGGGTRLKIFEGMAMGTPVVSTSIGIEGLSAIPDRHYLAADTAGEFADAVIRVLGDAGLGLALSQAARALVEERFGVAAAARAFEAICLETAGIKATPAGASGG